MIQETLREKYAPYFDIGTAVNGKSLKKYHDLIVSQFNSLTCDNMLKPGPVHPKEDEYDFAPADEAVAFAQANGMRMRGHTFAWHVQQPDWLYVDQEGKPVSRNVLLERMKEHMRAVMTRYKGKIYCWDVANEAVDDDFNNPRRSGKLLRQTPWLEIVGEDYLELVFRMAHEIDPAAQLFYNDFNECLPEKRDCIIQLVKNLIERDTPIHGLGLQAHWTLYTPTMDQLRQSLDLYAALGLRLQITEMDISFYDIANRRADISQPDPELMARQAEKYRQAFEIFREYKDVIDAVTFWGVTDGDSWLSLERGDNPPGVRMDWPLLFNKYGNTKPAYDRVMEF